MPEDDTIFCFINNFQDQLIRDGSEFRTNRHISSCLQRTNLSSLQPEALNVRKIGFGCGVTTGLTCMRCRRVLASLSESLYFPVFRNNKQTMVLFLRVFVYEPMFD